MYTTREYNMYRMSDKKKKKKEFELGAGRREDGREGDKMRDKHRHPFGGYWVHTVITRWKNTNYFHPPTHIYIYICICTLFVYTHIRS